MDSLPKVDSALAEARARILPLIARRVQILHGPGIDEKQDGGGDWDCAIEDGEPYWPLRLPHGVKLCQCLHYDVTGRSWIVADEGDTLAIDTLEDPSGLGKYGISTSSLMQGDGQQVSSARRAAYLTAKRIYKKTKSDKEWRRIQSLAQDDANDFVLLLRQTFGPQRGSALAHEILSTGCPGPQSWRMAARYQRLRRVITPVRLLRVSALSARRWVDRVSGPTGMHVVVVGPDGCGKSSLATSLAASCTGLFRRDIHYHWRPGLFPRPGKIVGRDAADPTRPHDLAPRSRPMSALLAGYYWFDFLAGSWLLHQPFKMRSGLVVGERGWWDMVVDPKRYRLSVGPGVMTFLGKLLPAPDLFLVLDASAETLQRRKLELTPAEISGQNEGWRAVARHGSSAVKLDAERPLETVVSEARVAIIDALQRKAMARLGAGWTSVSQTPGTVGPRWLLPRGPRVVANEALTMYQPVTPRGLVTWKLARLFADFGGFRLLPRAIAPEPRVVDRLGQYLPRGGQLALSRLNHPERFLALLLDRSGKSLSVAKLDFSSDGGRAVEREAESIDRWGPALPLPLRAPRVLRHEHGLAIYEPISWKPRRRPWRLPIEVASALGKFQRPVNGSATAPVVHGDFAPWNLLAADDGWYLVDWEAATSEGKQLFDLFHFLVQSSALLGHPSHPEVLRGLQGAGWVGEVIKAYLLESRQDMSATSVLFKEYLRTSMRDLHVQTNDAAKAMESRRRLLEHLG